MTEQPDDVVLPDVPLLVRAREAAEHEGDEDASARVFQAEIFFTGCTAEQAQEWMETINDLLSHNSEISASINDMSLKEV